MIRRISAVLWLLVGTLLIGGLPQTARAQGASADTIPPGTKITASNWQQYQKFMADGMKETFSESHFWHMPKNWVLEVGPFIPIPLPKSYQQATEKYGAQTRLRKVPGEGYAPANYVAGLPFPNPLKGDPSMTGQRIFWDSFYRYAARVEAAPNCSYTLDSYGNMTRTADTSLVYSTMTHVTDPGYPMTIPGNAGYWFAKYFEQVAPEQGKYTTSLILTSNDPTKLDEIYAYIPSLRRSLRLSVAARCSPLYGTDDTYDDVDEGPPGLPQLFDIKYLGEKKILALQHAAPPSFDTCGTATGLDPRYYYPGSKGVVPFPTPGSGKWEVRPVYVVEMSRLPEFARGYCYGKRVLYIDKETYFPDAVDMYDTTGHLWKWGAVLVHPVMLPMDNGQELSITGFNTFYTVNFLDEHATVFEGLRPCSNQECAPKGFLDISRYASPEGLMKVGQ
jgi:Protein of unknown function (DUF1329)